MLREGLLQDQPEAVHAVSPRPQVKAGALRRITTLGFLFTRRITRRITNDGKKTYIINKLSNILDIMLRRRYHLLIR